MNVINKEKSKISIVSFGGGGQNKLIYFHSLGIKAKYTCINDYKSDYLPSEVNYIEFFPKQNIPNVFCISNFYNDTVPAEFYNCLRDENYYVFIAGIGRYTGSTFIDAIADYFYECKKNFLVLCTIPFEFEIVGGSRINYLRNKYGRKSNFHFLDLNKYPTHNNSIRMIFEKANQELFQLLKLELSKN